MKKVAIITISILFICMLVCCSKQTDIQPNLNESNINSNDFTNDMNTLIVYFSCTNNTKLIAEKVAMATGGNLYRLEPTTPYSSQDLNYYTNCRADKEQQDSSCRVEILNNIDNIDSYDVIFVGYPIWHSLAPRIIYTFLESFNFSNKTIVPFCTSGSSGISTSINDLKSVFPNINILNGKRFNQDASLSDIHSFINSLNLN